ncbi:hypothetical protein VB779_21585 [Haloarculaceae archaeon H-GB11]|nr:hypothetical protein [Haloarculaceae archaeon H-GB11]
MSHQPTQFGYQSTQFAQQPQGQQSIQQQRAQWQYSRDPATGRFLTTEEATYVSHLAQQYPKEVEQAYAQNVPFSAVGLDVPPNLGDRGPQIGGQQQSQQQLSQQSWQQQQPQQVGQQPQPIPQQQVSQQPQQVSQQIPQQPQQVSQQIPQQPQQVSQQIPQQPQQVSHQIPQQPQQVSYQIPQQQVPQQQGPQQVGQHGISSQQPQQAISSQQQGVQPAPAQQPTSQTGPLGEQALQQLGRSRQEQERLENLQEQRYPTESQTPAFREEMRVIAKQRPRDPQTGQFIPQSQQSGQQR